MFFLCSFTIYRMIESHSYAEVENDIVVHLYHLDVTV
jgi:hypothetical protein